MAFTLAACAEMLFLDRPFPERVRTVHEQRLAVEIGDWTGKDLRALAAAVDSPHLRMNLDLYHAQLGEGNLIDLVRTTHHLVGEVQVADVPGRCEPGTGEISYPAVARALAEIGYDGVVGLEAWASGASYDALTAFRDAFTMAPERV